MSALPSLYADATTVRLYRNNAESEPYRAALEEWVERHGIDARRVPMESPIVRDDAARTVTCDVFVESSWDPSELVRKCITVQVEAPPLPWPPIVRAIYEQEAR